MCLLFIINNFDFIIHKETSTWLPIPISIVSLVFSVGSIMMGIYTGINTMRTWADDDRYDDEDDQDNNDA